MAVRDRYDARSHNERRQKPNAVSAEGLTYEQQRMPSEDTRRRIQDEMAVHLLWRALGRIANNCGDALDHALVDALIAALDDGSLVDVLVHVSERRANDLIARIEAHDDRRRTITYSRVKR